MNLAEFTSQYFERNVTAEYFRRAEAFKEMKLANEGRLEFDTAQGFEDFAQLTGETSGLKLASTNPPTTQRFTDSNRRYEVRDYEEGISFSSKAIRRAMALADRMPSAMQQQVMLEEMKQSGIYAQIQNKVDEMIVNKENLKNQLLIDLITDSTTTAFDGNALYSASAIASRNDNTNSQTVSLASLSQVESGRRGTAARPSREALAEVIATGYNSLGGFLRANGSPFNPNIMMKGWTVVIPQKWGVQINSLTTQEMISDYFTKNPLMQGAVLKNTPVIQPDPRLNQENAMYIFLHDKNSPSIIDLDEASQNRLDTLWIGSEYEKLHNQVSVIQRVSCATHAYEWFSAYKIAIAA